MNEDLDRIEREGDYDMPLMSARSMIKFTDQCDEELEREHVLLDLRLAAKTALDEVESLQQESQILEQKNKNATLESYTSTISHEFRTPLATCLMFLEGLVSQTKSQANLAILQLIISQLNLLLCLVNDVLDLKLI